MRGILKAALPLPAATDVVAARLYDAEFRTTGVRREIGAIVGIAVAGLAPGAGLSICRAFATVAMPVIFAAVLASTARLPEQG